MKFVYIQLLKYLRLLRSSGNTDEDDIITAMDIVWKQLTEEEVDQIDKEYPCESKSEYLA